MPAVANQVTVEQNEKSLGKTGIVTELACFRFSRFSFLIFRRQTARETTLFAPDKVLATSTRKRRQKTCIFWRNEVSRSSKTSFALDKVGQEQWGCG
jgi:hypothetical protein